MGYSILKQKACVLGELVWYFQNYCGSGSGGTLDVPLPGGVVLGHPCFCACGGHMFETCSGVGGVPVVGTQLRHRGAVFDGDTRSLRFRTESV